MLLGKQIIRKNTMIKRHRDPRLFLLGSFPTPDDIHIVTSKLPTNKQVLLAFIAKKEEFDQTENKKPMFKATMSVTSEQILPIYARARIPTKQANKIALDIVLHYRQGYHPTTPENKHAAVRLPKRQKLFIVKPQKVVEDQQNKGLHVHRVPFFR